MILLNLSALRDMFSSVNNRVNGFERVLARRSAEFRIRPSNDVNHFPHKSGCGPRESARRRRQMGVAS